MNCTCFMAWAGVFRPACAQHGTSWKTEPPWPTGQPAVPKKTDEYLQARQSMTDIENWIRTIRQNSESK